MDKIEDRIKKEIELNENRITEERLNNIAADYLPANSDEQTVIEMECEIETIIESLGGEIIR